MYFGYLGQLVVSVVFYVAVGAGLYWLWRRRKGANQFDELLPAGDATRYALASAVLKGARFRRRVIDLARHRYRAKGPELGLDFPLLLAACRKLEREDRIYDWLVLFTSLLCLPLLASFVNPIAAYQLFGSTLISYGWMIVLAVVLLLVVKAIRDVNRVAPYHSDTFDLREERQKHLGEAATAPPLPPDNVICYGKPSPFIGLGQLVGAWQVAVEMDRHAGHAPVPQLANGHEADGVGVHQLLVAVDEAVRGLGLPNLEMRFPLLVSGVDVRQIEPLMARDGLAAPKGQADGTLLSAFWYNTDPRARSYRWYLITDWNGEVVFSYMLRIFRRGQSLAIETAQLILAPIDEAYRGIDKLGHSRLRAWILAGFGAILRSPLSVLYAVTGCVLHLLELVGLANRVDAGEQRKIKRNPAYNYGAKETIREGMAARNFHVYFQGVDARQHFTAIDRRVLNTLAANLANAGIDVTNLLGQAQTIINNSTTIGGTSTTNNNFAGASGNFAVGSFGAGTQVGGGTGPGGLVQQASAALGRGAAR